MAYSFMALFIAVEVTAFITLVDAGLGAGGRILAGLIRRRAAEQALFLA